MSSGSKRVWRLGCAENSGAVLLSPAASRDRSRFVAAMTWWIPWPERDQFCVAEHA